MSKLNSLNNLYEVFTYDFYLELQTALLQNFDATIAEYSFAFPFSKEIQKTESGKLLKNSIEARIKLFHTNRNEESELTSIDDFKNQRIIERQFMNFYHLDNAIPLDIAENLTYGLSEQDENITEEIKNKTIVILVQLIDENHKALLGENLELPEKCYSVYDPRVIIRLEYLEDGENKLSSIPTDASMWYNQKLNEA